MFRLIKRAPWIVIGAAVAYYLDPASGITRRRRLRRRVEDLYGGSSEAGTSFSSNGSDRVLGDTIERRRSEDTVSPIPDAVPFDPSH
jgi:hypothetical protein